MTKTTTTTQTISPRKQAAQDAYRAQVAKQDREYRAMVNKIEQVEDDEMIAEAKAAAKAETLLARADEARLQALYLYSIGSQEFDRATRHFVRACKRAGLDPETWEGRKV